MAMCFTTCVSALPRVLYHRPTTRLNAILTLGELYSPYDQNDAISSGELYSPDDRKGLNHNKLKGSKILYKSIAVGKQKTKCCSELP